MFIKLSFEFFNTYRKLYKLFTIQTVMVFENLVGPISAKRHPFKIFLLGIFFSFAASAFSMWIFKQEASLVMVFLVVLMAMPLMYATFKLEEEEDWVIDTEAGILKEHSKAINFMFALFLGFVVGFAFIYVILPDSLVSTLFGVQLVTIDSINSNVVKSLAGGSTFLGSFGGISGAAISGKLTSTEAFSLILINNVKVMFFCLIFAFFFGAGAIFVLAWNASVISAAIGTYFRNSLANYAHIIGYERIAVHFQIFVSGVFRYMTHGIFEILAYFLAALAGGIISMALINHGTNNKGFNKIAIDVALLILIGFIFLVVGSFVEVYITPVLF